MRKRFLKRFKTHKKKVGKKYYDMTKEEIEEQDKKAKGRIGDGTYKVPPEAIDSIDIATTIFDKQGGISKAKWTKILRDTGQIETEYRVKIQDGGGPARSYWQVESATALDTLEQNAKSKKPIFGEMFEKQFSYLVPKGIKKTTLQYLSKLTKDKMKELLLVDSDLAATLALGVYANRLPKRTEKGK